MNAQYNDILLFLRGALSADITRYHNMSPQHRG